ncbi:MAG: glycosyltransferase family 25 protein [Rhizobacter sp.]|nr:glycosyltransferase family 25 protein [Ferruginibacter sp.]
MPENKIKLYVINLKSSKDRRKIMENQLNQLNIPFEIFDAVRGADLSEAEILRYYDKDYYLSRPDYFTPGAAGCTISHYTLYQKIMDEKVNTAIILEDDMEIHKDLPLFAEKLSGKIKDDEVVMLFYQSYSPIPLSEEQAQHINGKYQLYPVIATKGLRSTGGYIITHTAARRLVEKVLPYTGMADDWKGFYDKGALNGVRVAYPFLLNNTYESTTISPNTKGGFIIQKVIPFLDKNKIFPFHQLLRWRRKRNIEQTRICVFKNEAPKDFREN